MLQNDASASDVDDGHSKWWPCNVYSVADPPGAGETAMLCKQVEDLQDALVQATLGMAAMAAGSWGGRAASPDDMPHISFIPDATSMLSAPAPGHTTSGQSDCGVGCKCRDRRRMEEMDRVIAVDSLGFEPPNAIIEGPSWPL